MNATGSGDGAHGFGRGRLRAGDRAPTATAIPTATPMATPTLPPGQVDGTEGIPQPDLNGLLAKQVERTIKVPDADPRMFERDFRPNPAYFAVRDVLLQYAKTP